MSRINNNNDKSSILSNITTTNTTTGTGTTNTTTVPSIKTKRGLSYILGDSNSNENHILPINSIQYSSSNRQLYTAGRDGNVKVWQPHSTQSYFNQHSRNNSQDDLFSDCLDLDEKLLRLETSISSNPLSYNYNGNTSSNFNIVENYNLHFDWINDMQLINNDQNLITCSSDLSIKIIDLPTQHVNELTNNNKSHNKGTNIHKLPNIHTDYIKKLSPFVTKPTIVSGGLDGKIIVWDLNELKPIQLIENKANGVLSPSIYSLSNNHSNIISTGGPNNTINIFDQRANNPFIRNLIGHQDNIRCLLMNDQFILSGSSDTTIKLWDLRTFKVYKNFDIHDDSVWSLYSQSTSHDSFKTFYSGDKSGNIIKTDLSRVSIFNTRTSNDDEFGFSNYENNYIDEKLGISTLIAKSTSPILSICHEPEQDTIFTTNMESMTRYINPDTCQLSQYQYLRQCLDYSYNTNNGIGVGNDNNDELLLHDGQSNPPTEDLNSDFYDLISHLSMDTHPNNNIDLQSTLSHGNNKQQHHNLFSDNTRPISLDAKASDIFTGDGFGDEQDDENILSREDFDSMFLNVNGGLSSEFINAFKDETNPLMVKLQTSNNDDQNNNRNKTIDLTPIEILLNPIPIEQITLIPFNISPIEKYDLVPKSIVAKKMFNNRRQIMVLYLNGNIKIWDLVIFKIVKIFPYQQQKQQQQQQQQEQEKEIRSSQKLLSSKELDNRIKEMEDLFEQYQTSDTLNNWCEVEIKSGKLLVTIKESSYLNVEVYYDELISLYPFLDVNHSDNLSRFTRKTKPNVSNDDRFYLGIIMLNSIFRGYALYEQEFDFILREELKNLKQSNNPIIPSNGGNSKMLKYFGKKSSSLIKNSTSSNQSSPATSTNTSIVDVPIEKSTSNIGDNSNNGTSSLYTIVNEFINTPEDVYENSVNFDYGDTIMKLLQINKKIYWDKYNVPVNMTKGKVLESILGVDEITTSISKTNKETNNGIADLRYYPIIRGDIHFPKDLLITIFEYSSDLGNYRDLFSFEYQDLLNLSHHTNNNFNDSSTKNTITFNTSSSSSSFSFSSSSLPYQLIQDLRLMVPKWIGQPILFNKHPIKESPKITFQLTEVDYNQLPSYLKIGGKSNKKIKKLPELESSIKLTSHNMLRVLKILNYLVEKFANTTKEMKDKNLIPSDWLVLQCKGQELNNDLTLQTIKTKIWKSSSDIELQFRRKYDK